MNIIHVLGLTVVLSLMYGCASPDLRDARFHAVRLEQGKDILPVVGSRYGELISKDANYLIFDVTTKFDMWRFLQDHSWVVMWEGRFCHKEHPFYWSGSPVFLGGHPLESYEVNLASSPIPDEQGEFHLEMVVRVDLIFIGPSGCEEYPRIINDNICLRIHCTNMVNASDSPIILVPKELVQEVLDRVTSEPTDQP